MVTRAITGKVHNGPATGRVRRKLEKRFANEQRLIKESAGGCTIPRTLVLVRHGESEGNARNIFTGWRNLPLSERGRVEAQQVAERLVQSGLVFDAVFSSALWRAQETARIIIARFKHHASLTSDPALNERDYGGLTGLNKEEAAERFGAEQIRIWRRSFTERPPDGESLQDTVTRVRPYFETAIAPELDKGRNVLVVAHGNSLRALVMIIEGLSASEVEALEIKTGEMIAYRFRKGNLVRTELAVDAAQDGRTVG